MESGSSSSMSVSSLAVLHKQEHTQESIATIRSSQSTLFLVLVSKQRDGVYSQGQSIQCRIRSYKAEGPLQEIMHHFTLQRSRLDISNKVYFIRNIPYSPNPIERVFLLLKTCFRKIRLQKAISGKICSITSLIKDTLKLVNIETVQRLCRSGHARWKIRSFLDLEKQGY